MATRAAKFIGGPLHNQVQAVTLTRDGDVLPETVKIQEVMHDELRVFHYLRRAAAPEVRPAWEYVLDTSRSL